MWERESRIINFHISAILIILSISNNKFRIYPDAQLISAHEFPSSLVDYLTDKKERFSEPAERRLFWQTENINFLSW